MGDVLLPSRNVYIFVLLKKINDTNTTISPQNRNKYYYSQNLEGENHMDVAVVDQMDELLEFGLWTKKESCGAQPRKPG